MRVNLFGGPCCGKTTLALWLTSELKKANFDVEYVDEHVKKMAYEKKIVAGWNQYHNFNSQLAKEEFFLGCGVQAVVSDSPLLLQLAYMVDDTSMKMIPNCLDVIRHLESDYPSVKIFLNRDGLNFDSRGRFQNYEQSLEKDATIKKIMDEHLSDYCEFNSTDCEEILNHVFRQMKCRSC